MRRPPTAEQLERFSAPSEAPAQENPSQIRRLNFDGLGGVEVNPRVGPPRKKNFKRALQAAIDEANARLKRMTKEGTGAWVDADASIVVGLYAAMHLHVYKVEAAELEDDFLRARSMATRVIGDLGSPLRTIAFVKWCMTKEKKYRATLVEPPDFRITWKYLFSKKMVTDFRAANVRTL